MKQYFYLSATPESLVASHLPPPEFGNYLAVGTKKNIRGQAIFFEVDAKKIKNFPWNHVEQRLIPYEDGVPKRSVYLSIYRVFENTPVSALKNLYLVTDDGKVLELQPAEYRSSNDETHLYQQFNPITTRVASKLSPPEFVKFLTDPSRPVYAPKIFFADMQIGQMSTDPNAPLHNLPYPNPDHLRDCLVKLQQSPERQTKTVLRCFHGQLSYRCIKNGFYIGDQKDFLFYQFPPIEELEDKYYSWWRSALVQCF
jgi:hypothetical protein